MKKKEKNIVEQAYKQYVESEGIIQIIKKKGDDFVSTKLNADKVLLFAMLGRLFECLLETKAVTKSELKGVIAMAEVQSKDNESK